MIKTLFTGNSLFALNTPGMIAVYGAEVITAGGETVIVGIMDILASDYTWRSLAKQGLKLNPVVIPTGLGTENESFVVQFITQPTGDYEIFNLENTLRSADEELAAALCNRQSTYTPEMFYSIRNRLRTQLLGVGRAYLDKTLVVRANMSGFVGSSDNTLTKYQAQYFPATYPDKVMEKPEDELSLVIPSYGRLKRIYERDAKAMEAIEATEGYDSEDEEDSGAAPTQAFSQFDMGVDNAETLVLNVEYFEDLNPAIDPEHFKVDMGFPYYDSIDFRTCATTTGTQFNPNFIFGSDTNNELEVPLPNEQEYYKGLQAAIRLGLQEENDYLTQDQINAALESGQHSKVMDGYLQDMAKLAFRLGRRHTGHCTRSVMDDDDETAEDGIGLEIDGLYTLEPKTGPKYRRIPLSSDRIAALQQDYRIFDGFEHIKNYVANYGWGADTWAKVLVILLRFGNRKPRLLYVSGKDPQKKVYFDLEESKITELNGNKATWTPKPFADGSEYELFGMIVCDSKPTDIQYFKNNLGVKAPVTPLNLPVGVILSKYYEDTDEPEFTFVDMFTFIEIVRNNRHKISGVKFVPTSENPIEIADPSGLVNSPMSDVLTYLKSNSNMQIMYANIDLKKQYDKLCKECQMYASSVAPINIQAEHIFALVQKVLSTYPLDDMASIADIITSRDANEVRRICSTYKITSSNIQQPILSYVALEKMRVLLSVYDDLYQQNSNANEWDAVTIFNTFYRDLLQSSAGKTAVKRNSDECFLHFTAGVTKLKRFYPIVRRDKKIVGFMGAVTNPETKKVAAYYVWKVGDYDAPPRESWLPEISLDTFRSTVYTGYERAKASGKLAALMNHRIFCPNAGTMDAIAKM